MRIKRDEDERLHLKITDVEPGSVMEIGMGEGRGRELFLITDKTSANGYIMCVNIETGRTEWMPPGIESPIANCTVTIDGWET